MDGNPKSREALIEFLDYLADKGLMAQNTVVGRKATATKVLAVLGPEEAEDITVIDVEDVMRRFGHLHGKEYTPDSLATYQSRLRSALEDFRSYVGNPLGFRPAVRSRVVIGGRTREVIGTRISGKEVKSLATQPDISVRSITTNTMPGADILPIPIRADLTVRIHGLPFDLTPAEAEKIAAVVKAMAMTQEY